MCAYICHGFIEKSIHCHFKFVIHKSISTLSWVIKETQRQYMFDTLILTCDGLVFNPGGVHVNESNELRTKKTS